MPAACDASPVQLHIELGAAFVLAMVERFGVEVWNQWMEAMMGGYWPLGWAEHEPVPPIMFWIDLHDADLSGRNLDGMHLGLAWCQGARFDSASAVGATFGCSPHASFRNADLRGASFEYSDITSADFRQARTEGLRLRRSSFQEGCPPLGLPDDLLDACKPRACDEPAGAGAFEYPVPIIGCLTEI